MAKNDSYVKADGRILKLTNLEKVFFPEAGFRKRDLIRYYKKIAPVALPHLRDRPFTLKRFPNGINGGAFFEKQCPSHRPSWVQTTQFESVRYCVINDLPTLLWTANLAALELHTTLARSNDIQSPDFLVFDLDPGEGVTIHACVEAAFLLRRELEDLGLESFPKTSGMKGLHVFVPLNSGAAYSETKPFAHQIAERLEKNHPDFIVSRMLKKYRVGKVFIDWSQNTDFKTTTTVYSLRANETPTVSTALLWEELEHARKSESRALKLLAFEWDEVLKRVEKYGDLFEPVLKKKQKLPSATFEIAA